MFYSRLKDSHCSVSEGKLYRVEDLQKYLFDALDGYSEIINWKYHLICQKEHLTDFKWSDILLKNLASTLTTISKYRKLELH